MLFEQVRADIHEQEDRVLFPELPRAHSCLFFFPRALLGVLSQVVKDSLNFLYARRAQEFLLLRVIVPRFDLDDDLRGLAT